MELDLASTAQHTAGYVREETFNDVARLDLFFWLLTMAFTRS
jgi:hypothetical protein